MQNRKQAEIAGLYTLPGVQNGVETCQRYSVGKVAGVSKGSRQTAIQHLTGYAPESVRISLIREKQKRLAPEPVDLKGDESHNTQNKKEPYTSTDESDV